MKALLLAAVLAALSPAAASAASAIPAPHPPQNPFMATVPESNIHNDTWMTDAYARRGPTGRNLVTGFGPLAPSLCSANVFDRHGHILTLCPSSTAPPEFRVIDPATLTVLGHYTLPDAPTPKGTKPFQNFSGGGYFFQDRSGRIWAATKTNHVFVLEPSADGRTVTKVEDFNLRRYVVGDERITSALPDFSGRLWFVTKKHGKVGILDPRTRRVHVRRTGEEIENSFTVDRDGVYIVSDKRMYRFGRGKDGRPKVVWSVRYPNSGIVKPSQVDAGSGTTPTILPGGYVAITDNADPMHVVAYRTKRRLSHGVSRIACEIPVFTKGQSATENSLIGSGRSLIVENNYGYRDPFGPQAGNISETGFTRVDLRKGGKGCVKVWTNRSDPAPSVVPKLSTATQLVYTYTQTLAADGSKTWSWVAISARTGRTVFRKEAGSGLFANNNYAGLALGPDGTAYLGTIGGIRTLRDGP
jgi:hypothetical protein